MWTQRSRDVGCRYIGIRVLVSLFSMPHLNGRDSEEIARNGPMGMAKNDMSLGGNGCGFDRRVRRTLAVAHDDDPLGGQLVTRLERRHMDHLALKLIAAVEDWDVRRFRVKSDADHG